KILGQKTVFPLIRSLFERGFILISEEIKERYKPKVKTFLTLASSFSDSEGLRLLLENLQRSPKQQIGRASCRERVYSQVVDCIRDFHVTGVQTCALPILKILGQKTVFPLIRSLFERGFILISEEIKERYKPKVKTFLTLASSFSDSEGLRLLLENLQRSPKQ